VKGYFLAYTRKCQYLLLLGDILALFLSLVLSYSIRIRSLDIHLTLSIVISKVNLWWIVIVTIHIIALWVMDQYDLRFMINFRKNISKLIVAILVGWVTSSCLLFFAPKYILGREVVLMMLISVVLIMTSWRIVASNVIIENVSTKRLSLVGKHQSISDFINDLSNMHNYGYVVNSICITDNITSQPTAMGDSTIEFHILSDLLKRKNFDTLAFDSTNGCFSDHEAQSILELKFEGKEVTDLSSLYENLTGKVPVAYIDGRWLLKSPELQGKVSTTYLRLKRIFDILMSTIFLIMTSPLFLLIIILIKWDSRGPVFFVQERLGFNRKPFKCYKFRSMVDGAERTSGPTWAAENDPRITPLGRFLRRTRLDELPQLWNILKGDMTVVGPRPIRNHFAKKLEGEIPFYGLRFCVKPGLTGWAQVNYDYAGSAMGQMEKFQYELFYIRNMSLFLDLLTLFKTVKTVIKHKGL
jgi:exopolysaccharide biosynthesis polyprenyl glycosylphosphotransferase